MKKSVANGREKPLTMNPREMQKDNSPQGWALISIKDMIDKIPLTGKKLKRQDYLEMGNFPVIDQGQKFIGGYTNNDDLRIVCKSPIIVFGDHTKIIKYVDFDFVAGADGVKVIKPISVYNPKLFFYFLQVVQLPEKGYARHFQYLEKSDILLPPLPEQHRIVAKIEELFTKLDAGIEALKKIKIQLKRYRQAVLKHAFEGKLTAEWRKIHRDELEPAFIIESIKEKRKKDRKGKDEKPTPIDTTHLTELPSGWQWTELSCIAEFKNGINFNKNQKGDKGILTIDVLNMYSKSIFVNLERLYRVDKLVKDEYILKYGDILFVRSSVKREGVGWTSAFKETIEPVTFCGFIIRARLHDMQISPEYTTYFLRSEHARESIIKKGSQVTITNISQSSIGGILIPLTSAKEQQKIVEEIERRFSVADEIEKTVDLSIKHTERLRHSILKRAFEGKLVPQDPNDEPASELLERIKIEKTKHDKEKSSKKIWKRKTRQKGV